MNYCAYTGRQVEGPADAIWDDGEWISWEYINSLDHDDAEEEFDGLIDGDFYINALVAISRKYFKENGRYLSIWGELGELYAEAKYGIKRHKAYAQGSDGRVGNDLVEVKTMSPEKTDHIVEVKRSGNFNVLIVVKIDSNYNFQSRWIDRKELGKGVGKMARYNWENNR